MDVRDIIKKIIIVIEETIDPIWEFVVAVLKSLNTRRVQLVRAIRSWFRVRAYKINERMTRGSIATYLLVAGSLWVFANSPTTKDGWILRIFAWLIVALIVLTLYQLFLLCIRWLAQKCEASYFKTIKTISVGLNHSYAFMNSDAPPLLVLLALLHYVSKDDFNIFSFLLIVMCVFVLIGNRLVALVVIQELQPKELRAGRNGVAGSTDEAEPDDVDPVRPAQSTTEPVPATPDPNMLDLQLPRESHRERRFVLTKMVTAFGGILGFGWRRALPFFYVLAVFQLIGWYHWIFAPGVILVALAATVGTQDERDHFLQVYDWLWNGWYDIRWWLSYGVLILGLSHFLKAPYVYYLDHSVITLNILLPILCIYFASSYYTYHSVRILNARFLRANALSEKFDVVEAYGFEEKHNRNKKLYRTETWIRDVLGKSGLQSRQAYLVISTFLFAFSLVISFFVSTNRWQGLNPHYWAMNLPEKAVITLNNESKESNYLRSLFDPSEEFCSEKGEPVIAIAASGGGSRAAFNVHYALAGLREKDLLKNVRLLSGVSGGTAAVAFFAQRNAELKKQKITENSWVEFKKAVETPFIEGVVKNAMNWDVIAGTETAGDAPLARRLKTTTALLFEELDKALVGGTAAGSTDFIAEIGSAGLIFNTTVRQTCQGWPEFAALRYEDWPRTQEWCLPHLLSTGSGSENGMVATFSNLSIDLSQDDFVAYDFKGSEATLAHGVALSGNFPPIFEDAPIDFRFGEDSRFNRIFVTDGGAAENRGMITLLLALRTTLQNLSCEVGKSPQRIHILEIDSGERRELKGADLLDVLKDARDRLADSRVRVLLEETESIARRRQIDITVHRLALPSEVRTLMETHWRMPRPKEKERAERYLRQMYDLPELDTERKSSPEWPNSEDCADRFFSAWISGQDLILESEAKNKTACSDYFSTERVGVADESDVSNHVVIEMSHSKTGELVSRLSCSKEQCSWKRHKDFLSASWEGDLASAKRIKHLVYQREQQVEESLSAQRRKNERRIPNPLTISIEAVSGEDFQFERWDEKEDRLLAYFIRKPGSPVYRDTSISIDPGGTIRSSDGVVCRHSESCQIPAGAKIAPDWGNKGRIFTGFSGGQDCEFECDVRKGDTIAAHFTQRTFYFPYASPELAKDETLQACVSRKAWQYAESPEVVIVGSADTTGDDIKNRILACDRARNLSAALGLNAELKFSLPDTPPNCRTSTACREQRRASIYWQTEESKMVSEGAEQCIDFGQVSEQVVVCEGSAP